MKEENLYLVKVKVRLKEHMRLGVNKWNCHIHGEEREVTLQDVVWYSVDVEAAVHSFRKEEIESFTITGSF